MLANDGTVFSWGVNDSGECGQGSTAVIEVPTRIPDLFNVVAVSAGFAHCMVLCANGSVYAFGYNRNGEVGNGTTEDVHVPTKVHISEPIEYVKAGSNASFASSKSKAWVWGYNDEGRLGLSNVDKVLKPTRCAPLEGIGKISQIVSGYTTLALTCNGHVYAFGQNDFGQLGQGHANKYVKGTIHRVKNLPLIKEVATGYNHCIALARDGTVYTWGNNEYGQLGLGEECGSTSTPRRVPHLTADAIASSIYSSFVITRTTSTLCGAGYGYSKSFTPVKCVKMKRIVAQGGFAMAVAFDGSLYSWEVGSLPIKQDFPRSIELASDTMVAKIRQTPLGAGDGTKLAKLEKIISKLQADGTKIQAQISRLKSKNRKLKTEISELKSDLAAEKSQSKKIQDSLAQKLDTQSQEITKLQQVQPDSDREELLQEIKGLKAKVQHLEVDVKNLKFQLHEKQTPPAKPHKRMQLCLLLKKLTNLLAAGMGNSAAVWQFPFSLTDLKGWQKEKDHHALLVSPSALPASIKMAKWVTDLFQATFVTTEKASMGKIIAIDNELLERMFKKKIRALGIPRICKSFLTCFRVQGDNNS